jgi:hypothetical protein
MQILAGIGSCAFLFSACVASAGQLSDRQRLEQFANAYVAAVQSKNTGKVMTLLHPTDRACVNARSRSFFDYIVTQQMTDFPSGKYDRLSVTPLTSKDKPMIWGFVPEKDFPYPVMPSYKVQLDYTTSGGLFTDLLETAKSGDTYYWVTACPTRAGLQFVRTTQEQGARQQARAKQLVSAVRDPLLAKIKALLAAQDKIGAITAYRKATGADLTTAVDVIDIIAGEK